MRYSFDPVKRASNLTKHGLDLADAPKVIESGEAITFEDRRYAYDEERFVTLGPLGGVLKRQNTSASFRCARQTDMSRTSIVTTSPDVPEDAPLRRGD
jgi:uncharacterized DUF497 family protein